MKTTICIPVLNRYDLLASLLRSLHPSIEHISSVFICDNGNNQNEVLRAVKSSGLHRGNTLCELRIPLYRESLAENWNYFIANTPNNRIITNDDITFGSNTISNMLSTPGDLIFAHGFSCFLIRDRVVNSIGYFDPAISPGFAYFEDLDYMRRIEQANHNGAGIICANCDPGGLAHYGSATTKGMSRGGVRDAKQKYFIAQENYIAKWGIENFPSNLTRLRLEDLN